MGPRDDDRVQREVSEAEARGDVPVDEAPDDEELMVTLGSSQEAVTEFNELLDTVPDEPADTLDH